MIQEYRGFSPSLYPITEPIIVRTFDYAGRYIWLLVPEICCSCTISGSDGNQNILIFIKLMEDEERIHYCYTYHPIHGGHIVSNEELISLSEKRCPEFLDWLIFHADLF